MRFVSENLVDNHDSVTKLLNVLHVVTGQDDGAAIVFMELLQEIPDALLTDNV